MLILRAAMPFMQGERQDKARLVRIPNGGLKQRMVVSKRVCESGDYDAECTAWGVVALAASNELNAQPVLICVDTHSHRTHTHPLTSFL
jgi:hypothetical protein